MRHAVAITAFCLLPLTAAIGQDSFEELPGLPISSVQQADAESHASDSDAGQSAKVSSPPSSASFDASSETTSAPSQRKLTITPGVNEVIPISLGHTNRFLVPFEDPQIRTTSTAGFDVEGRAVYVMSNEEGRPVTAFISESGNPEVAMSLTFVPSRMPPVEMNLQLDNAAYAASGYRPGKEAAAWETSQPYVTTLRDLLRDVARGETPQGYTLSDTPLLDGFNGCFQEGLAFDFYNGQTVDGHRLRVNVGVIENTSSQVLEFREPSCAGEDVKAVAAWPNPILEPGQKTEVYVVRGVTSQERVPYNTRRSLLEVPQ